MKRILAGLLLLGCTAPALAADAAAQDVINCMRDNVPTSISMAQVTLTTTSHNGDSSTLSGNVYATQVKAEDGNTSLRAMLRLYQPKALAGAAFLVRETHNYLRDGMFVYLPSVNRVRRVTGSFADGALLGTNISYFDFKQMKNAFGDMHARLLQPDSFNGRGAYVLMFTPLPGVATDYTGVKVWVDKESCLAVKADFMQGQKLIKRLSSPKDAIQQAGDYWYLSTIKMSVPAKGSHTVMKVGDVVNDAKLSELYFSPHSFYKMR